MIYLHQGAVLFVLHLGRRRVPRTRGSALTLRRATRQQNGEAEQRVRLGIKHDLASLDHLAPHRKIQLAGGTQIRPYQVQIAQLDAAVILLRLQEIQQRGPAVLIGK